jgi:hypothetical protein
MRGLLLCKLLMRTGSDSVGTTWDEKKPRISAVFLQRRVSFYGLPAGGVGRGLECTACPATAAAGAV